MSHQVTVIVVVAAVVVTLRAAAQEQTPAETVEQASASSEIRAVWNLQEKVLVKQAVQHIVFHPTREVVALDLEKSTAYVWDLTRVATVAMRCQHNGLVADIGWHPSGESLATASYDGTVKLWAFPSGQLLGTLQHPGEVRRCSFSPSGDYLATVLNGGDRALRIWDVKTGQVAGYFKGAKPLLSRPMFSSDGRYVAVGEGIGAVMVCGFRPGGNIVTNVPVASTSPRIRQTAPSAIQETGQWIAYTKLTGGSWEAQELTFVPGTHLLVSGGNRDATVRISDLDSGQETLLPLPDGVSELRRLPKNKVVPTASLVAAKDGSLVVAGGGRGCWAWRFGRGVYRDCFSLETGTTASAIAFSPNGKQVVIGTWNSALQLWDVGSPEGTARLVQDLPGHTAPLEAVAFSPSGKHIVSGGHGEVIIWKQGEDDAPVEVSPPLQPERVRQ